MKLLDVGKIVAAQGLKGELRVYPESDFPERFLQPGVRWLQLPNTSHPQQFELLSGRSIPGKKLYIIKLAGIEDIHQAEALRGAKFLVDASDRPSLKADEYHVADLVGLEVIIQSTGEAIGRVTEIYTAGNDLLEVTLNTQPETVLENDPLETPLDLTSEAVSEVATRSRKKKKTRSPKTAPSIFIPFVAEIVPVVDIKAGRIEIIPPPGLLEVNLADS
ncbi:MULTISPECIES: ribosome maturation factor RimM [Spirulina sp. CCY15215]|uniref:ribosome maturation factor RimM n=1 Tax=Spirulina sp. CCY15215 TaxID=2767591 RepID=UPI001951F8EE|nr:ribosome maturation factor RimM [Spirulina major]